MKKPIACPGTDAGQRDLAPLYLAGRLAEEEAEAFEAHYLGCPKCREDIRAGAAMRELYGKPGVAASARPSPARRSWLPLAAAAAIAFAGVGVWQAARRTAGEPGQPVLRSENARVLGLEVETGLDGSIDLTWQPHPKAAAYEVQIVSSDGVRVWGANADEPRLHVGSGVLPAPAPGRPLEVEVRALDAMGQVLATSDPAPLPAAK